MCREQKKIDQPLIYTNDLSEELREGCVNSKEFKKALGLDKKAHHVPGEFLKIIRENSCPAFFSTKSCIANISLYDDYKFIW